MKDKQQRHGRNQTPKKREALNCCDNLQLSKSKASEVFFFFLKVPWDTNGWVEIRFFSLQHLKIQKSTDGRRINWNGDG